jgi:hypothetical protein
MLGVTRSASLLFPLALLYACGGSSDEPIDASNADAGTAGLMDAGAQDAGALGDPDAGTPGEGRCGDGTLDAGELCDDGERNGTSGQCNETCSGVTAVPEGDLVFHWPRPPSDTASEHYRVLLVLVDAVGGIVDDPATEVLEMYGPEQLGDLFFGHPSGANAFYREASYGRVSLSGSAVGWFEPRDGEVSADQMFMDRDRYFELATPHIDYAEYEVVVLVGNAHSGGTQRGWRFGNTITVSEGRFDVGIIYMINSTVLPAVTDRRYGGTILPAKPWAHELGHTLGLGHATSIWCTDAVLCDDFEVRAYGDIFNYMGAGEYASHPDVLQKLRLGWLDPSLVPELTPGVDTQITLYPLALADGRTKGVRIPLGTPQAGRDVLAVEYRTPTGFDAYMDRLHDSRFTGIFTTEPIDSVGLLVHLGSSGSLGEATSLVDMHPTTPYNPDRGVYTNGNPGKMADAFLNVGESFTDPVNGYTLTNRGLSDDGGMILGVTWE